MAPRGGGISKLFKRPLAYRVQNRKYPFNHCNIVSQKLAKDPYTNEFMLKISGFDEEKFYSQVYQGSTLDELRDIIPENVKTLMLFFSTSKDIQREHNPEMFEQLFYIPFPGDDEKQHTKPRRKDRGWACQLTYYVYHGSCYLKDRALNWMRCRKKE
jgi:hypothetical protein